MSEYYETNKRKIEKEDPTKEWKKKRKKGYKPRIFNEKEVG